jgi:hypothetical protein
MIAALLPGTTIASAINDRGNCVTGGSFPDTKAGSVNKEIYGKFSADDKQRFQTWINSDDAKGAKMLAQHVAEIFAQKQASGFNN